MKQDSGIQLSLNFESDINQVLIDRPTANTRLHLIYSNPNQLEKTSLFFSRDDDEIFEPILNHARSLSW